MFWLWPPQAQTIQQVRFSISGGMVGEGVPQSNVWEDGHSESS